MPIRGVRRLAISAATALLCGCGTAPSSDVSLGQTVLEMADAINGLQEESALMQAQLDSLREVVARQDTVVRRIASMAGVPVPAP